ncbi:DUF1566 domain-containing protein, partial [bacterium]|nr:DUF1566 domain-containing protein [bacterium]
MKNLRITTFLVAMTLMTAACAGGTDSTGATAATASTGTPATTTSAGDEPASTTPPEAIETVVAAVSGAYPIVDTGQDACYTDGTAAIVCPEDGDDFFGQDGNYQGSLPTHTDNGDGTVTDVITGLMWQQDPGDKMTYDAAVSGASSFDLAGYDDWRLPTIKELYSLIDFSGTDPSGCQTADCAARPFIDTDAFAFEYGDTDSGERQIDSQWATSTIYVGTTMNGDETMFGVNFADGRIKGYGLTNPGTGADKEFFVIYVRGNTAYGDNVFVDMGDGTVADLATGLMWQ